MMPGGIAMAEEQSVSSDDPTLAMKLDALGDFSDILPPVESSVNLAAAASKYKPRIEGYDVEEKIGEGGMATVWSATQLSTRRRVALKLMSGGAGSDAFRQRFDREV